MKTATQPTIPLSAVKVISVIIFSLISGFANGQVYINEILASNATVNTDPDHNQYADWVELYNAGASAINLKGYFLTDNLGNPGKWQIMEDLVIEPGGFRLIWADDRDSGTHAGYKLSASGEEIGLFSPSLVVLDSFRFGFQRTDISYGRKTDGSAVLGYFRVPTPGASNTTEFFSDFVKNVPEFTLPGQIYNDPVTVGLFTDLGGTIRYTTDGTEPDDASAVYPGPLQINTTTILRARIFRPSMIPGPVMTQSYFIDSSLTSTNLPVVSIATDPKNFWDPEVGIYVQDFKPLWEIPANIELFENNNSDRAAFNEKAGIKINGLYSWQLPQKMLGLYFNDMDGPGNLGYPVMFHKKRSSYKSFALRASGNDWSNTMFRDILGQDATRLNMDLDYMDFRPSITFFNGQYMGIHNIREKVDEDFIARNHNIPAGTFDMVENTDYAEAGDLAAYNLLLEYTSKDLAVQANYDAVGELMDIGNFTDMVIAEMATGNYSIDHNVMAWKPKNGGKWKWVLMDLDRGYFDLDSRYLDFYRSQSVWPLGRLMSNPAYITYLGKRLADHLYTSFNPIRMSELIGGHAWDIEAEMPNHIERWLGATSSYGNAIPSMDYWYREVSELKTYTAERPYVLLNNLKSYGFSNPAILGLTVFPNEAGILSFNGLKIPNPDWTGPYPLNSDIRLAASPKPGYRFLGWKISVKNVLVPKGAVWKYLDDGSDQGNDWMSNEKDDAAWKSGPAELGYGDNDEVTKVSFGSSSSNKFITTYFRHHFNVTEADLAASSFVINLRKDDGAVVYLNGHELIRTNLTSYNCNYRTLAIKSLSGVLESGFSTWLFDRSYLVAGDNLLAVEIHQDAVNSSDISFDMELAGWDDSAPGYISTVAENTFNFSNDMHFTAVFEATGQCTLPAEITTDLFLDKACSPYLASGDVTIHEGATLTIQPGVEIWMPHAASIRVNGIIHAQGTDEEPILFKLNPSFQPGSWGILNFLNTPAPSTLSWVTIENTSVGDLPITEYAGISAFKGDIVLDHLTMVNIDGNPIVARYSDVTLTNSTIHSKVTGDGINVKYGNAYIENCVFEGNAMPDADGIDYDDIHNGVIRNCLLKNFRGFNSDGVDVGEGVENLMIDSILVFNAFDKGISVGQRSSVQVTNSTFINCNMGLGLKDLSHISIDHCTFYGNGVAVNCYEKNPGSAGGIAQVTNSILSNSSLVSYSADAQSSLDITYSLSDNDPLPNHPSNEFANPLFVNPTRYDFDLLPASPAINAGNDKGAPSTMGAGNRPLNLNPNVLILLIYINSLTLPNPEFIALVNPSDSVIDLSGYSVDQGITCTIPHGTKLNPRDTLYLTDMPQASSLFKGNHQVITWAAGKLSDNGEAIQLRDSFGMVVDHLRYSDDGSWPTAAFTSGELLSLINTEVDNHFGSNWISIPVDQVLDTPTFRDEEPFILYPNPGVDIVTIVSKVYRNEWVVIYSSIGTELGRTRLDESGQARLNVANFGQSILIVRVGDQVKKLVVVR
ncbi:MAG: lamin tail domain-containing protein [Bacteroidales bacterium]